MRTRRGVLRHGDAVARRRARQLRGTDQSICLGNQLAFGIQQLQRGLLVFAGPAGRPLPAQMGEHASGRNSGPGHAGSRQADIAERSADRRPGRTRPVIHLHRPMANRLLGNQQVLLRHDGRRQVVIIPGGPFIDDEHVTLPATHAKHRCHYPRWAVHQRRAPRARSRRRASRRLRPRFAACRAARAAAPGAARAAAPGVAPARDSKYHRAGSG